MNIRSLSINFVNLYTTSAPPATAARLSAAVPREADNTKGYGDGHGAGRTNRLTQALTAALRDIGIGGAGSPPSKTTAPATTDTNDTNDISDANDISDTIDTAAASAATPSTNGNVNAAVEQFAHALMDALGAGRSARGHGGEQRQDGERSHHGHGSRNTRYGNFAQRLESLSRTIVQTLPAAQPPAAPASAVVPSTAAPISLAPTVESELGVAAPASPSAPTAPNLAPTRSATSTLLDAFSRLFDALKPRATADAPATDMATRLQQFLHTMAQTLSHTGWDGAAAPQTGAFVDVKA